MSVLPNIFFPSTGHIVSDTLILRHYIFQNMAFLYTLWNVGSWFNFSIDVLRTNIDCIYNSYAGQVLLFSDRTTHGKLWPNAMAAVFNIWHDRIVMAVDANRLVRYDDNVNILIDDSRTKKNINNFNRGKCVFICNCYDNTF